MAFKRRAEPTTIDEERAALREQYDALEDLKHQLAERVDAVRERELELHHLLAEAGGSPPAPTRAAAPLTAAPSREADDLDTDENALAAEQRERALMVERERAVTAGAGKEDAVPAPAPEPSAARLAEIEARLAELRDAEKQFLRTRDELAARSEALAARERLAAQKERELDEREDAAEPWVGPGLSEMEARLRRLEQQQPGEQTLGFSSGLKKLEQGTKRPQ